MNKTAKSLIIATALLIGTSAYPTKVSATGNCNTGYYGGGVDCSKDKSFEINKKVRIEGENKWKDKVTDVKEDETVEFLIEVKNVGEVGVDNMNYEDFLPDEMERTGGSGLTEYWNDFDAGDTVKYIIEAKVKSGEYDDEDFEKCVVNKVELYEDDDFKGSDTATVCYGNEEEDITELPETGPASNVGLALSGLGLIALGTLVKRKALA